MTKKIFDSAYAYCDETGEFLDFAYEDEKEYFQEFLNVLIEKYEKQYKTSVERLALVGRVGLWNGSPVGGKIISANANPIEHMGEVDRLTVEIDDEGLLTLYGGHHDGVHRMNLYLLTDNKLKNVVPDYYHYREQGYEDMERIYENLKPLKVTSTITGAYYGQQAS